MPAWPATLPAWTSLQEYSESPPDNIIVTPMSAGPPKLRRRFTGGVREISGELLMTIDQIEILDVFFRSDLQDGSLLVTGTHPRTDAAISATMGRPTYSPHGGGVYWWASIALSVMP